MNLYPGEAGPKSSLIYAPVIAAESGALIGGFSAVFSAASGPPPPTGSEPDERPEPIVNNCLGGNCVAKCGSL
jgi:hypothetical protein